MNELHSIEACGVRSWASLSLTTFNVAGDPDGNLDIVLRNLEVLDSVESSQMPRRRRTANLPKQLCRSICAKARAGETSRRAVAGGALRTELLLHGFGGRLRFKEDVLRMQGVVCLRRKKYDDHNIMMQTDCAPGSRSQWQRWRRARLAPARMHV